ncbi:hypothetical protein WICMUC_005979 [Wickerhamomyces mucosus]|uniref:Tricalbin-1 n=1 Tax=Wickerhamomyces mucosus TaxID=1378264 RepID=A0A9P8T239_9ASCO|nr:hypothetical protein WICMUC_005979 [Wickerhamomyces mucosus]
MSNIVEAPVLPSDPTAETVGNQDDLIKKTTDVPYNAPVTKSIDSSKIQKAEKLAEEAKRNPVLATSVGWKQIGEWEEKDALTPEDELMTLDNPTILDRYLPEKFYGNWYHSVGVVIAAGLLSFIIGWFRFSIAPLFFVVLVASIFYRTSIKKYRTVLREEIQREFTIKKIEDKNETMDWLNTFLEKYWIYLEPSISQIVTEQVNPILASNENIPGFIKAIWIDQFTAGTKPPRIDFVKTLNVPKDDIVVMDWCFSFTPHSVADISYKQSKNYVNQRIVVKATLFGITLPVIVENFHLRAWARVRFKMIGSFPHIETVNVSVMEPPRIDFIAKLLGESIFNWEILAFPGLLPLINELVKKFAGPILFKPFSFELNIPQLLAGSKTSVGILAIKVKSAKDLKAADRVFGNTIDPYLTFHYRGKDVAAKTKTILDTLKPTWDETVYILVNNFTDPLTITVFDYNEDRKDKNIGNLQLDMNVISSTPVDKNRIGQFLRNSKPVGELLYDYEFFPTLEETKLADGSSQPPPDLNTGLCKIELTETRHVKGASEKLSSYVELYFNDKLIQKTSVSKNNENPTFNISFESIVLDRRKAKAKILVKDPKGKILSASVQSLNDLIDRTEINKEWVPFSKGEGEYKISAIWKSVGLRDAPGVSGYTEPIGVVRVLINKAQSLRNLETVGKVDPYIRILVNGTPKARTDFIPDTLDPVWNEALYIPVTSPNQRLTIEALDVERSGLDRTLGEFSITTSAIIEKNDNDKYIEHVDQELRTGRLVHKKGPKGIVTYALSFYPVLPVKTLEDIEEELKRKDAAEKAKQEKELKDLEKNKKENGKKKKEEEVENDFHDTNKLGLTLPELTEHQTGLFVYTFLSGEYHSINTYLQVYFDNHGYPDYTSHVIQHKAISVPQTGDGLIKQLEWSTITFRLVKDENSNRISDCIAESTIPVLSLLKNSYYQPNNLTLTGLNNNKIRIQTQWIPVQVEKLPQSDLITNSGNLDLDIISGTNLISSDSNGKSDPFVKVYIQSEKEAFFKTKVIKKTLNPTWDEKTQIEVKNRVNTTLRFKCLDWDFGAHQDDYLGEATLNLSDIDPINPTEYQLPIKGPDGQDGGFLTVKTSFRPRFIVSVNNLTTNFGDVGLKAVGTGLGAGLDVGKSVIGGGVGAVGAVGKVGKGFLGLHKKDKNHPQK